MQLSFLINACLLFMLCQADKASAKEDYFAPQQSSKVQGRHIDSTDPDVLWAQRYYTGKRISGDNRDGKKIITVPLKKVPVQSPIDDTSKEVASIADDQRDLSPAVTDELSIQNVTAQSLQPSGNLPPGIDRGVTDLEAGLLDLRGYSIDMAAHIKKNGLRGFMYVTPELKSEGQNIGKKIGGGVRGIMQDVGNEMSAQ